MEEVTVGLIIIGISILGYISNWLNWRFLNYKINHLFYYIGAFVHESSHALACIITGAKIHQYKIFVDQPRVSYSNPKFPLVGNLFISIAPIFGGLLVLFLVNKYFFTNQYIMPDFSNWRFLFSDTMKFIKQINITDWKNIITIFLFLNIGSTIAPSWQDLKNVWFLIIILVFIPWAFFSSLGLMGISFILINIVFQIFLIIIIYITKSVYRFLKRKI
jgi:hypothetical protein